MHSPSSKAPCSSFAVVVFDERDQLTTIHLVGTAMLLDDVLVELHEEVADLLMVVLACGAATGGVAIVGPWKGAEAEPSTPSRLRRRDYLHTRL